MWPRYSRACRLDVDRALRGQLVSPYRSNRKIGIGPRDDSHIARFERALEGFYGVKHGIGMNSGTMALVAAIKALRLPAGSEIIVPPYSFSATVSAVILAGHTPRFADVDCNTFCLSAETVAKAATRKTRALVVVNLFGYVPDYKQFARFGLPIIEDAAQSQGVGGLNGVISCGSGNGSKNIPCVESGWAYTNDRQLAERMRLYISHQENFEESEVGVNGRMHELAAILALHGLRDVKERNEERAEFASYIPRWNQFMGYYWLRGGRHAYYCVPMLYKLRSPSRATFVKRMNAMGVSCGAGYITPSLEKYEAFKRYARGPLPVVTELSERTLVVFYEPFKGAEGGRKAAEAIRRAVR